MKRICVFAGSNLGVRDEYSAVAQELGRALAHREVGLIYGGARVGLMGAIVNVHCVCEPEVAAERFLQRDRHPGHQDGEASHAEVLAGFRELARLGPIGIGQRVPVDTSVEPDLEAIVRQIGVALNGRVTDELTPKHG
jgi:hypothetical protein